MSGLFHYIVCVAPEEGRAPYSRHTLAHMAWQTGEGMALQSLPINRINPGSYMVLTDAGEGGEGTPEALTKACLAVCEKYGLSALVCDFERPARRSTGGFIAGIAEQFTAQGLSVYVHERYADVHPATRIIVPTAITQGSLRRRLQEACQRYGAGRIALDMERLSRDIKLPSAQETGTHISPETLTLLLQERGGTAFYSGELCAHYFTNRDSAGATHFYVYDDAHSFAQKVLLAQSLGIRQGFVLHPDAISLGL